MFGRGNLFGLKASRKPIAPQKSASLNDRYFVQGEGQVQLGRTEFKAQGGEGAVYVKGPTAYKIYSDHSRCIAQAKIDELSSLVQPNIIRPVRLILDGKNIPVGYTMRAVGKAHSLCQLFPKAFRQRNNITPEITLRLVRQLQTGVLHIHSRGILVVDLNEMNFLVSADFAELFFIDVDSYQTPSFPATALMETVRDRHATAHTRRLRLVLRLRWFRFRCSSGFIRSKERTRRFSIYLTMQRNSMRECGVTSRCCIRE